MPAETEHEITWRQESHQSGSLVVATHPKYPHYRMSYGLGSASNEDERWRTAQDLCDWLNGGEITTRLAVLIRTGPNSVQLQNGQRINVAGPMIDPSGEMNWTQDDRPGPAVLRCKMITAVIEGERPQMQLPD